MMWLSTMLLVLKVGRGAVVEKVVDGKTRIPDGCSLPYGAGDREKCLKAGQHAPTDTYDKNFCLTYQFTLRSDEM